MDTSILIFVMLAVALAGVAIHAWRLGNDGRDVALLGVVGRLCGAGAAVAAIL